MPQARDCPIATLTEEDSRAPRVKFFKGRRQTKTTKKSQKVGYKRMTNILRF